MDRWLAERLITWGLRPIARPIAGNAGWGRVVLPGPMTGRIGSPDGRLGPSPGDLWGGSWERLVDGRVGVVSYGCDNACHARRGVGECFLGVVMRDLPITYGGDDGAFRGKGLAAAPVLQANRAGVRAQSGLWCGRLPAAGCRVPGVEGGVCGVLGVKGGVWRGAIAAWAD